MATTSSERIGGAPIPRVRPRHGVVRTLLAQPLASYYLVLIPVVLLVTIGQLMSLSSSSVYAQRLKYSPYYFSARQLMFLVAGIPLAWWLSRRSADFLRRLAWPALGLAVVLLIGLFVPGIGEEIKGNRAWLRFGRFMTLQPAEFAKLAVVVWSAAVLHNKQKVIDQPKHLLPPLLLGFGIPISLIMAGGDLGTAMVVVAIMLGVLFIVGTPLVFFGMLMGLLGSAVGALVFISANRMSRIAKFLNPPSIDDPNVSQQPVSALYALATGGWWGVGLGGSRQKWGGLADAAQNDYVFAVLGEELGLFGAVGVIALFGVLFYAGLTIAKRADTLFVRMVAGGITIWMMFQTFLNLAVALNWFPVVGVPLPFISVGGSALLSNLLAVGILLACARQEPAARKLLSSSGKRRRRVTRLVQKS